MRQEPFQGRVCACVCVFVHVRGVGVERAVLRVRTGPRYLGFPEKKDKTTHSMPGQACFLEAQGEGSMGF